LAVSAAAPRALTPSGTLRDSVLWAAVAAYAVVYFLLGYVKYAAHRNFVDLGIFAQTAASAFGCFCNPIEGSHWAFHFSPILYAVGAVVQVWHSALALVAVQAIAGALTAPPVYGIVRRYADRKTALLAALVALLYPPLAGVVFNDFHENGLAPAAIAWLLWAFDGGYAVATLVFAAVALSVKEDQAFFLTAAGAIGAFAYRQDPKRRALAITVGVAALAILVIFFTLIQPHANANSHWAPGRFYVWGFGVSNGELVPAIASALLQRAGYLLLAFVPLLFVPFRSRAIVLAILPLVEVLASTMSTTFTMGSHYAGAWIGYVFFAFALGIASVARLDARRAHRLLYWCIGLCVLEFAVADPLHPGYFLHPPAARDARLERFLRALPPAIDVATQEEAYTHLAATDPKATLLPETFEIIDGGTVRACYILTDSEFPESVRLIEALPLVNRLAISKKYAVISREGPIVLYKARSCANSSSAVPAAFGQSPLISTSL
jgi:uncharacterized membrane protein